MPKMNFNLTSKCTARGRDLSYYDRQVCKILFHCFNGACIDTDFTEHVRDSIKAIDFTTGCSTENVETVVAIMVEVFGP